MLYNSALMAYNVYHSGFVVQHIESHWLLDEQEGGPLALFLYVAKAGTLLSGLLDSAWKSDKTVTCLYKCGSCIWPSSTDGEFRTEHIISVSI